MTNPEVFSPELLAPAGNWECAKAAVANGANAIYFGLDCGFNARVRADNFSVNDLPELLAFLHRHSVKGYVTLNTLAFTSELAELETLVRSLAVAGVDAILVQDLGVARLIRKISPALPLHASTQMTLTSAECIAVAAELGIERVVIPRELSLGEIAKIHAQNKMPLEAFVHGALCVAYSGQCLTSESLGGRSANRGQCAQACRLPYELIRDGELVDLGAQKYLLSPQDLAAYALIPELIKAGVVSLKIEGRLKTAEYVANITRHYRQAIDSAVAGKPVEFTPRQVEEMELSFTRGFSTGWLKGCDHKALVPALSSSKRGILAGEVTGVDLKRNQVQVRLSSSLKAGDGIVFDGDRAAGTEQGARIFTVSRLGKRLTEEVDKGYVELEFHNHAIQLAALTVGQKLWKTDDPALTRQLRKTFSGEIQGQPRPVQIHAQAEVGQLLQLTVQTQGSPVFEIVSESPLEEAQKHPLTEELLREQLGRLGETGFKLGELKAQITGQPMIPLSSLGKMRRQMVMKLQAWKERASLVSHAVSQQTVLPKLREEISTAHALSEEPETESPQLMILCRQLSQLESLLELGADSFYADFQDIREYREAVALAHERNAQIFLATPRIQKPGEMGIFYALSKHGADGFLVRNLAALDFFRQRSLPCIADFSLNVSNELTFDWLLQQQALRVTASYDMNQEQLLELTGQVAAERMEVVIHQHMPMFHMEHCVFCAMISPGTNKTNCGRPCDRHEVKLRDRVGAEHPLIADVGCRNTLFNKTPQSGAEVVPALMEMGVRHFRVELLPKNSRAELGQIVQLYRHLLAGTISGQQVWSQLQAINRVGVTRGTLEHSRNPLAII